MTDRELLELAAKAAGIEVRGLADKFVAQHNYGPDGLCVVNDRGGDSLWNPLTDDGDALRLAVKLQTPLFISDSLVRCVWGSFSSGQVCDEVAGKDPYTATRRAIVRAAAEIGRAMT